MNPDTKPFGETTYKNYDPEQVNTVEDAADVFEWLSRENRKGGNGVASSAFDECAQLLRDEVIDDA
jgi:hypothetical protein